ncbi:uncharacterized protein ACR2FA_001358 [Aphomia sociella]
MPKTVRSGGKIVGKQNPVSTGCNWDKRSDDDDDIKISKDLFKLGFIDKDDYVNTRNGVLNKVKIVYANKMSLFRYYNLGKDRQSCGCKDINDAYTIEEIQRNTKLHLPNMELRGLRRFTTVLLLLLAGEPSKGNDTVTEEIREPRSNRRVVKLYSGTRPEPFKCLDEGFQADPSNCAVFYRCIKSGRGKYTPIRFQCAPGTVYDPDSEVCNHPQNTKRSRCGSALVSTTDRSIENEIIDGLHQELPSPISTKQPVYLEGNKLTTVSHISTLSKLETPNLTTKYPWALSTIENNPYSSTMINTRITSTKRQSTQPNKEIPTKRHTEVSTAYPWFTTKIHRITRPSNRQPNLENIDICNSDGFVGDSENCRKFYRCVNNQRGGFIRYEFLCSESTIWDDDIQSCNHAWAVKRRRCGRGSSNKNSGSQKQTFITLNEKPADDRKNTIKKTQKNTETKAIHQNKSITLTPLLAQTNKINKIPQKYHTNHSKQHTTTFSSLQYNEDYDDQGYNTVTTKPTNEQASYECTESGFIGDRNDCTKFYRCIDNGKGSYSKHEFSCGEGTVWDPKIESCNHAWAVDKCGSKSSSESGSVTQNIVGTTLADNTISSPKQTKSTTRQTTTQSYLTNAESTVNEIKDEEYGYHNEKPISLTSSNFSPSKFTTTVANREDNNCVRSGFMGDKSDCKKFYRCVDDGQRGYTRFEFSCGEGTVWDSKIEACNHAWAVEQCGGNNINNIDKIETTTSRAPLTSMSNVTSTSVTQDFTDDYDAGYGSQHNEPLPSTTLSTTISMPSKQPALNDSKCSSSGFMGDKNDCKRFYRCVDNGNGGYTRYEFSCGEGTVWDSKIEACNHVWAVENCKNTGNVPHITENPKPTNGEEIDNTYPIYNDNEIDRTTENIHIVTTTTTTIKPPVSNNNMCMEEGFYGDPNECRKFYRCVNNQRGGFIRYEFTCGEGTIWDTEINSCNHAESVKNPCNSNVVSENIETTSETMTESTNMQENLNPQQHSSTTKKPSVNTCSQEGFIGDEKDCKKFYRCVNDGHGGYLKYEFTCGDGTVWDSEIQSCNHESSEIQCSRNNNSSNIPDNSSMATEHNIVESTSTTSHFTDNIEQTDLQETSNNICTAEGFYSNSKNCKKFYRCVENGKGGYTKYDFTCGEGTIWDQKIQSCNYETSDNKCSNKDSSESAQANETQKEDGYNTTSKPSEQNQSQSTDKQDIYLDLSNENDECVSEGFFANSKNCKQFYRCVNNGNGGYNKYEFTCGDGTVWVQEIQACDHEDDIRNCSSINKQTTTSTTTLHTAVAEQSTTTESADTVNKPDKQDDEYDSGSTSSSSENCSSEGFHSNKNDCKSFYRCVDNGKGGYTRYDFKCGEGTAWDPDLQTCNHINEVKTCGNMNQESNENKPMMDEESPQTTETNTENDLQTSATSKPTNNDKCENEGYYGNRQDCTKFYRCVDNGKGGYTKYDYTCGEGTIWDQDLLTCNHPQDVTNPSCEEKESNTLTTTESSNSMTSTTTPSQTTTNNTTNSQDNSNCTQENSTKSPDKQNIKCEKAGFYANPNDCKKFYRCVDWDGNGQRFSVYHFDCGEGTIWDPQLETCNHEESVYPPRDCSGVQSQNEVNGESTTSKEDTTATTEMSTQGTNMTSSEETTTDQSTTSEKTSTTTQQSTSTEESTSQQPTTTEQLTTQKSTTTEQTTSQQSTTTEKTTSQQTTTTVTDQTSQQTTMADQTTSQPFTTTEQTTTSDKTTQQSSSEQTTEYTSTSEQNPTQETTDQSTTNDQTTSQSTTEQTTHETTTNEQTTQLTTNTEESTTQQSTTTTEPTDSGTTTEPTDSGTTTEGSTSEQQSTTTDSEQQMSTTEAISSTTQTDESSTTEENSNSSNECPETDEDQYLYVCPTSFKRHPKYCNMFYQCTEDDDTHEPKIAVFTCPNNTIYDESKVQCVEEEKTDNKCNGEIAQRRRVKRLNVYYKDPIVASRETFSCSSVGYYPFESNVECSPAFLKCQKTKSDKLRGYVHQCPEGYYYWSISKRCERKTNLKGCKLSSNDWNGRWQIPYERKNIAA